MWLNYSIISPKGHLGARGCIVIAKIQVEILKIIVGAIFTIIAGFWASFLYAEDERRREHVVVTTLNQHVSNMYLLCDNDFGSLEALVKKKISKKDQSSRDQCAVAFRAAYSYRFAAETELPKPFWVWTSTWNEYWRKFHKGINRIKNEAYNPAYINKPWCEILLALNENQQFDPEYCN